MAHLLGEVARFLRLPPDEVSRLATRAPTSYKRYLVPKRSGGSREILHPAKTTKAIQYAIMHLYLSRLPVHEAAFAYRYALKSPLRQVAIIHAAYRYTVRLDLENFFPSIKPTDLLTVWRATRFPQLNKEDEDFLTCSIFAKRRGGGPFLAIGAPASPVISNAVMVQTDIRLSAFANGRNGAYSRYADDLFFSTNRKGECRDFSLEVRGALEESRSPRLILNAKKTRYMSMKGRRTVTGLILTPDGGVSIGRARKRYVKKLLCDVEHTKLDKEKMAYLRGMLAFILDVEPDFYNRLAIKYGATVMQQARRKR